MFRACGGFKTRMFHTFYVKQMSTQRWRDLCVFLCVCISSVCHLTWGSSPSHHFLGHMTTIYATFCFVLFCCSLYAKKN